MPTSAELKTLSDNIITTLQPMLTKMAAQEGVQLSGTEVQPGEDKSKIAFASVSEVKAVMEQAKKTVTPQKMVEVLEMLKDHKACAADSNFLAALGAFKALCEVELLWHHLEMENAHQQIQKKAASYIATAQKSGARRERGDSIDLAEIMPEEEYKKLVDDIIGPINTEEHITEKFHFAAAIRAHVDKDSTQAVLDSLMQGQQGQNPSELALKLTECIAAAGDCFDQLEGGDDMDMMDEAGGDGMMGFGDDDDEGSDSDDDGGAAGGNPWQMGGGKNANPWVPAKKQ